MAWPFVVSTGTQRAGTTITSGADSLVERELSFPRGGEPSEQECSAARRRPSDSVDRAVIRKRFVFVVAVAVLSVWLLTSAEAFGQAEPPPNPVVIDPDLDGVPIPQPDTLPSPPAEETTTEPAAQPPPPPVTAPSPAPPAPPPPVQQINTSPSTPAPPSEPKKKKRKKTEAHPPVDQAGIEWWRPPRDVPVWTHGARPLEPTPPPRLPAATPQMRVRSVPSELAANSAPVQTVNGNRSPDGRNQTSRGNYKILTHPLLLGFLGRSLALLLAAATATRAVCVAPVCRHVIDRRAELTAVGVTIILAALVGPALIS